MAAFVVPGQSGVVATEAVWPAKLKMFTIRPFTESLSTPVLGQLPRCKDEETDPPLYFYTHLLSCSDKAEMPPGMIDYLVQPSSSTEFPLSLRQIFLPILATNGN